MNFDLAFAPDEGFCSREAETLLALCRRPESRLRLTSAQALSLARAHVQALQKTGRVEFGPSAAAALLDGFSDSPWLAGEDAEATLHGLIRLFYECRNETMELLSDQELIERMRRAFDGPCRGSLELMEDEFLLRLPRSLRAGKMSGGLEGEAGCL